MDYISRIKAIKSEKKITNERLSELTGIPLGTLSKLLAGINDSPKLSNVVAIANALGCTLDYLVSGIPQNDNNYTLSVEEIEWIEQYRSLDSYGKELVNLVTQKEVERVLGDQGVVLGKTDTSRIVANGTKQGKMAKILEPTFRSSATIGSKRSVLLYDLPVSAGPGVYLDDSTAEEIHIPNNEKTQLADFEGLSDENIDALTAALEENSARDRVAIACGMAKYSGSGSVTTVFERADALCQARSEQMR